jgi:hypothetical protein
MKYPIYRKFKNGKEFMKLNSDGILIQVLLLREKTVRITCTDNRMHIEDFHNPEVSVESSRDEFEKTYGQAQYLLTKANIEQ